MVKGQNETEREAMNDNECHCTHHKELEAQIHSLRNAIQKLMEVQTSVAVLRSHIAQIMLFLNIEGEGFH